jgi:hypothetical protein
VLWGPSAPLELRHRPKFTRHGKSIQETRRRGRPTKATLFRHRGAEADLQRSTVRQGNPRWSSMTRDGEK